MGTKVIHCLVLQEEHHPSAMGIGQSKEGFSVFGIFNQCVSPMGKRLLRLWFRRPIINLTAIKDRQVSMSRTFLDNMLMLRHVVLTFSRPCVAIANST